LLEQGLIRDYLELDFTDYTTVFDRAMRLVRRLDYPLDGVTTYYEDAVPLAARIAYELQLMGNPVSACESARNKQKTRSCLKEKGLAVPAFSLIREKKDLEHAAQVVGFPAILKPVVSIYQLLNDNLFNGIPVSLSLFLSLHMNTL
jgi:biotin carboxylase